MTDGKGRGWHGDPDGHRKAVKKAQRSRVGQAFARLGMMGKILLFLPLRGLRILGQQARGTWRNANRAWDYLTFDNILPPGIVDLLQWFIETTPKMFGVRGWKPWHQIGAAITLLIVAFLSTALSGGILIGTVIAAAFLLLVGVVRLIPAANHGWNEWTAALPVKDDYNVPRWKRD